ncbi:DUF4412 domain-containing protein [Pricia sp. S334]|uniref:DUF4412 domain-containing protein n=1 Tax=Pricia mediterranea TaxID=3076079 RepID=A0ABU3L6W6_9FLAO|nr:DUF4412 domain-containing protein [Pricia sp. S334]MDT7829093.1 DUF4412 domain-containing protein [Pricia sp. S334]
MKIRTKTFTFIVLLLIGTTVQGQFLKKLGKRAEKAAERTVLNRADEEAAKKTDQALDEVLTMEMGTMGGSQVDPDVLPGSYEFDWRYTLRMSHEKGDIDLNYFLSEDGGAFGSRPELNQGTGSMGNMLMVIDPGLETTTILMDNGGQKTGMVMSNPDLSEAVAQESDMDEYELKEIGTKEILGYTCQGFQMENEDTKMTMYIAFDTPVSFSDMYSGSNAKQLPKGFDPKWLDKIGENSLMMEMDFVNKKKKKQSAKMTCVALEKDPMTIDLGEYNFSSF